MKKMLLGLLTGILSVGFFCECTWSADEAPAEEFGENVGSIAYELPEGMDLNRELWLIEKLRMYMGAYTLWGQSVTVPEVTRKSEGYLSPDRLFNSTEVRDLWKIRWNVELPEYIPVNARSPEIEEEANIPRLDGVMEPLMWRPGGGFVTEKNNTQSFRMGWNSCQNQDDGYRTLCVRNGNSFAGSTTFLVATCYWPQEARSIERCGPCKLEYLFIGKCVTRTETGERISLVRPTGLIFTLNNDADNTLRSCVSMTDGRMTGKMLAWSNGKLVVDINVVEDGTLPIGSEPRPGIPFHAGKRKNFTETGEPYVEINPLDENTPTIGIQGTITGDGFVTCFTQGISENKTNVYRGEVESRLLNPNDYWMPWTDLFPAPPFLPQPTFYRIAFP